MHHTFVTAGWVCGAGVLPGGGAGIRHDAGEEEETDTLIQRSREHAHGGGIFLLRAYFFFCRSRGTYDV